MRSTYVLLPYSTTQGSSMDALTGSRLPRKCPECQREFSTTLRLKWRMQKKAVLVFALGVVLFIVWPMLLFSIMALEEFAIFPTSIGGFILMGTVMAAPGLAVGYRTSMPRMTTLKCIRCKWKGTFVRS